MKTAQNFFNTPQGAENAKRISGSKSPKITSRSSFKKQKSDDFPKFNNGYQRKNSPKEGKANGDVPKYFATVNIPNQTNRQSHKVPPHVDSRIIHIEMEQDEQSSYYSSIPKREQSNADSGVYPIVQGLKSINGDKQYLSMYNDDPEPERPPMKGKGVMTSEEGSATLRSDTEMEIRVTQPGQKGQLFGSKSSQETSVRGTAQKHRKTPSQNFAEKKMNDGSTGYLPRKKTSRSPQQFYNDQIRKEKEKFDRIESARQKQQDEESYFSKANFSIGSSSNRQKQPSNANNLTIQQERGLVNRLAYASPKRYKQQTLEASDKYKKYQFKPQICQKSVTLVKNQVDQGKWQNVNNVYDHLSKDVIEREQRKQDKINSIKQQESQRQKQILQPNNTSTSLLGQKFKREFYQAVNTLTSGNADLNSIQEMSNSDIGGLREQFGIAEDLNFQLFRNVLFCVGFTKNLDSAQIVDRKKNILIHLWDLLNVNSNECIKTQGLFNFLAYLQSVESIIDQSQNTNGKLDDRIIFNKYGYTIDGIFFIKNNKTKQEQKVVQSQLIKDFYELLNNKKNFERQVNIKAHKQKTLMEMRLEETHKPQLAPKTLRHQSVKNRGDLSRRDYSDVLASRSMDKLEKIRKQKEENEIREVQDCTFKPKVNKKTTFLRGTSNSQQSNQGSIKSSGAISQREKYVDNYLYKPKLRQDRSTDEIEFERQKNECLFKPQQLSKNKNYQNVAVSKIKLYIQTGQSPTGDKQFKTPSQSSKNVFEGRNGDLPSTRSEKQTKESSRKYQQISDSRPVILQMEVLISQGQTDYVIVHKGENIEQIVQKFAQKHNLTSTKQNKLLRLVQQNAEENTK